VFLVATKVPGEDIENKVKICPVPKPRIPRLLWKYCGVKATPILSSMEIKLTRPNEFNDPFEWSPAIAGVVTDDDVKRLFENPRWVEHWDAATLASTISGGGQDELHRMATEFTNLSREIMAEELDRISSKYALLCLSANPSSILMWSHYAENHHGFVIGIDHRKLGCLSIFPVAYSPRRVTFRALTPMMTKPKVRSFEIFTRKSTEWAYEREYRMIWRLDDLIPRRINGTEAYTIPLIPEAIAEIRIGYRATREIDDEIRNILTEQGCSAKITRAALHPRRFQLEFR
jgi:hypothetical protein